METLVTFLFEAPPDARSIELFGSWDNFSKGYPMHRDTRRGGCRWTGCHRFSDIICDGDLQRQSNGSREGALKMGGTYWYYYLLDDYIESHDSAKPSTTACPLLPGQQVNVLEVPREHVDDRMTAFLNSLPSPIHTLDPRAKYRNPKPIAPHWQTATPRTAVRLAKLADFVPFVPASPRPRELVCQGFCDGSAGQAAKGGCRSARANTTSGARPYACSLSAHHSRLLNLHAPGGARHATAPGDLSRFQLTCRGLVQRSTYPHQTLLAQDCKEHSAASRNVIQEDDVRLYNSTLPAAPPLSKRSPQRDRSTQSAISNDTISSPEPHLTDSYINKLNAAYDRAMADTMTPPPAYDNISLTPPTSLTSASGLEDPFSDATSIDTSEASGMAWPLPPRSDSKLDTTPPKTAETVKEAPPLVRLDTEVVENRRNAFVLLESTDRELKIDGHALDKSPPISRPRSSSGGATQLFAQMGFRWSSNPGEQTDSKITTPEKVSVQEMLAPTGSELLTPPQRPVPQSYFSWTNTSKSSNTPIDSEPASDYLTRNAASHLSPPQRPQLQSFFSQWTSGGSSEGDPYEIKDLPDVPCPILSPVQSPAVSTFDDDHDEALPNSPINGSRLTLSTIGDDNEERDTPTQYSFDELEAIYGKPSAFILSKPEYNDFDAAFGDVVSMKVSRAGSDERRRAALFDYEKDLAAFGLPAGQMPADNAVRSRLSIPSFRAPYVRDAHASSAPQLLHGHRAKASQDLIGEFSHLGEAVI